MLQGRQPKLVSLLELNILSTTQSQGHFRMMCSRTGRPNWWVCSNLTYCQPHRDRVTSGWCAPGQAAQTGESARTWLNILSTTQSQGHLRIMCSRAGSSNWWVCSKRNILSTTQSQGHSRMMCSRAGSSNWWVCSNLTYCQPHTVRVTLGWCAPGQAAWTGESAAEHCCHYMGSCTCCGLGGGEITML